MYLKFGSQSTPANKSALVTNEQVRMSPIGKRISRIVEWTIKSWLQAATQAALWTAIDDYEDIVRQNNVDLTWYQDDGTETFHKIVNSQTANGVELLGISYPGAFPGASMRTEGVYVRYVVSRHRAEVFDVEDNTIQYYQSVRRSTGGADFHAIEALNGPVTLQITKQQSKCYAIQSGTAVGMFSHPEPPASIIGQLKPQSWVEKKTAEHHGRVRSWGFRTTWYFYSEAVGVINAVPPATFG